MIIVPKLFNLYARLDRPTWQQWRDRRLWLLRSLPPPFWHDDLELIALAGGPQLAVSSFPQGTVAAAAASQALGTLTLTTLVSSISDDVPPVTAGIRFRQNGTVAERSVSGSYISQNPGTEWTDESGTPGDLAQARMLNTSGTTPTFASPWNHNTYRVIDQSLTATHSRTANGTTSGSGTAYVRETANTSNEVTASYTITAQIFDTILL